jgi:hypothetical protein
MSRAAIKGFDVVLAIVLAAMTLAPADAAEPPRCLSASEQKAAIANKAALPLGRVVGNVRKRGEVVRARLCHEEGKGLVYMLTVLSRDGKVTRTTLDAADGQLLDGR